MKSFLHIKAKKIETIISYFDNHLWNVGIQKKNHPLEISLYNIDDQAYKILKDLINYFGERNENVENYEK